MSKLYNVKINNSTELKITTESVDNADIIETTDNKFHLLQNNIPFKAEIISSNFLKKEYTVNVNNNKYNIVISDALDMLIKDMGFTVGASKLVNNIKAPMPGLILDINVAVGDPISENQPLLILEAMKMENSILSLREGTIKSISVKKGDAVEKGNLLIEFE